MSGIDDYHEFLSDPDMKDAVHHYISIRVDVACETGFERSDDSDAVDLVADVIGSKRDHDTRQLAAFIVGGLEESQKWRTERQEKLDGEEC